jgi:GNAT superfamily N-acetyltransferase
MPIAVAESDSDIARCFPVIRELRPHLTAEEFVPRVRRMNTQGYRLAFLTDAEGEVRAVAGFRPMDVLYAGRTIYVDDLITAEGHRSRGYGDQLFDWLVAHARSLGCDTLHLDSGTQRVDAHRFYLRKRMKISSFHFVFPLQPPAKR